MKLSFSAYAELEQKLNSYCSENKIFGVLRVTKKDEILLNMSFGYANLEEKTEFTEKSMFTLYSLSKPFCTLGFLKLCDKRLADIDAHPSKYIPEAQNFDSRVTFRHALHHISGLPDFEQLTEFNRKYAPGYARRTREHLRALAEYPQYFAPGEKGMYANINMILPALAIENVTGLSYAEYMKKEVFEPLGMESAVVGDETTVIPNRVQGYGLDSTGVPVPIAPSHDWLLGAGDIVATADDVYCLNRAIKERKLISPAAWDMALTPAEQNSMGMGCTVFSWHGKTRINHNGGHLGFRTLHIQLPGDDFDVIFLSNSGYGEARGEISEILHEAFYAPVVPESKLPEMDKGYI